jgi:hypothetical protein
MTSLDDVRETVRGTDHGEWIPFNEMGTWTYRDDVHLRIQRYEQLDANFQAPWTQHLQATSQSFGYVVYYGNSPVEYHTIVSVDNFRAHIPLPQAGAQQPPQGQQSQHGQPAGSAYTITPYQATLGRIITGDDQTFDAYLSNTGVSIQE